MIKWIKGLFTKKKSLICGGVGRCAVVDNLDREIGNIYFDRPTSKQKMDYIYDVENVANNKSKLKELSSEGNGDSVSKKAYEVVINELCIPHAEKVFNKCDGYTDSDGNEISKLTREEQFNFLKEYYAHNLVDMVVCAFSIDEKIKKKS